MNTISLPLKKRPIKKTKTFLKFRADFFKFRADFFKKGLGL